MEEMNIIQSVNTIKGYLDAIIESAKKIQSNNVELKEKAFEIANLL